MIAVTRMPADLEPGKPLSGLSAPVSVRVLAL